MEVIKLGKKGQVSIPKSILSQLGLAIASLGIGKSNWFKDRMLESRRNSKSPESG